MKIGILALQGAFEEHRYMLEKMGINTILLRKKEDIYKEYDGLILPGGESTVQGKLLKELDMFQGIKEQIEKGIPVLGTCAGLILLGGKNHFNTLPVKVIRNGYGRQLGSFKIEGKIKGIGEFPMKYIRAPYIDSVEKGVEIISFVDGRITGVKYGNQIGLSFHPELTEDDRIHSFFIDHIVDKEK